MISAMRYNDPVHGSTLPLWFTMCLEETRDNSGHNNHAIHATAIKVFVELLGKRGTSCASSSVHLGKTPLDFI